MINCLISELSKKSVKIILESEAILVEYSEHSNVKVTCRKVGDERKKVYSAHFVLLTSPCLQNLEFEPELPHVHQDMIHRLLEDCVPAMKSVLRFDECFWQKQEHGGIVGGTCSFGPSLINQIRLPPFYCEEDGYIMIYLVGEPVNEWLNLSEEERIKTVLEAMEKLFPSIEGRIREHFKGMSEAVWNEAGSGAYLVFEPEKIRDAMQPVNRLVFSSVPRGWVEDALKDGKLAVEQIQKLYENKNE